MDQRLTRRERLDIIIDARRKDPCSIFYYDHFRVKFLEIFFHQEAIFPTWVEPCLTYLRAHQKFDQSEYQELVSNKRYYETRIHDDNLPIQIQRDFDPFPLGEPDVARAVFFQHLCEMKRLGEEKVKLAREKIQAWDDDIKAIEQARAAWYISPQDLYVEVQGDSQQMGDAYPSPAS